MLSTTVLTPALRCDRRGTPIAVLVSSRRASPDEQSRAPLDGPDLNASAIVDPSLDAADDPLFPEKGERGCRGQLRVRQSSPALLDGRCEDTRLHLRQPR